MPSFKHLQAANEAYIVDKPLSLDAISLKESTNTELVIHRKSELLTIPLPLPPSKKFLSNSLPNSATSSPRFGSNLSKKGKNQGHQPSPLSNNPLAWQHSVALANLERLKENHLRRSNSCVEGISSAPPEKYNVGFTKVNNVKNVEGSKVSSFLSRTDRAYKSSGSTAEDKRESYEEKFKCGAMCLFIPGLGKAKPVRARREETGAYDKGHNVHNFSRKVSLEKFECGSRRSSGVVNLNGDEENESNRFFDLPMELIRCSTKDTCSPETAAFVFDKVLKKAVNRKSNESTRQVRLSTSSPDSDSPKSCITPRLTKTLAEKFTHSISYNKLSENYSL